MTLLRTQTKKQFRRSSTSEQMNKIHFIHKKNIIWLQKMKWNTGTFKKEMYLKTFITLRSQVQKVQIVDPFNIILATEKVLRLWQSLP